MQGVERYLPTGRDYARSTPLPEKSTNCSFCFVAGRLAGKNWSMDHEFPQRIRELVERAKEIRRKGIEGVDPEEYTKQHLIEPLFKALGYDSDDIRKEFHILGDQCDYLLETRRP